ncbi:hypothetical protein M406DRAFT_263601 [Cryphonectria parasitica EP155]|uniref:DUF202 domain-containing protein n=1 Tax=Cryphonectria parasitica (strain ATCC 38755 / EP155) TaxID=660469 RepID=A0A9P4XX98_CRYP1|nr:uncharacterized protein M406DRAFT_263601 [Cryphonectria parasitica EP155]KAF3762460.1 hypothetical protein M406DRAFT_263601 [Cryphonectria parasitica EP155]
MHRLFWRLIQEESWYSTSELTCPGHQALQPHPEDHLHLRLHRARSVVLTAQELTEIRAAQRTFEGAYMRTALSQFSFALIILKIFTSEFYAIGALFAAYGAAILLVAIFRRYEGNRQFFDQEESDSETDDDDGEGLDGQGGDAAAARGRRRVQTIRKRFRTSGNSVTLLTVLSLGAYITLMVLMLRLS